MCGNPLRLLSPIGALFGAAGDARKQRREQARVQAENLKAQEKLAADAQKAEANRTRTPNIGALASANSQTAGVGSTMLTGPGGIASASLTLGRNSLLGG